jgi:hypothetical protein
MPKLSESELVTILIDRLTILNKNLENLKCNDIYAGLVATDLRVLVVNKGNNKPLLLDLADKKGFSLEYQTDAPPHMSKITTLADTLNSLYQSKYEGEIVHTNLDLINTIANKEGAHIDQNHSINHIEAKSEEYLIGGRKPFILQLIKLSELVLFLGNKFIKEVKN